MVLVSFLRPKEIRQFVDVFFLSRWRCAACLARFPQIAMLHHLLARPRVWSANTSVQLCPSHAFTLAKSSSHPNFANASPIGSNRESGDRQRRTTRSSKRSPLRSRWRDIWLNVSSRWRSLFKGPNSRSALGGSCRPICLRTNPLNHSRKARAWSATLFSSPGTVRAFKSSNASGGTSLA